MNEVNVQLFKSYIVLLVDENGKVDDDDHGWDEAVLTMVSSTTARWIVSHRTRYDFTPSFHCGHHQIQCKGLSPFSN